MNLYLISQTENNGYDTYDSAIVVAESALEAKKTHPRSGDIYPEGDWDDGTWVRSPESVEAQFIGSADDDLEKGVVLASFNAG